MTTKTLAALAFLALMLASTVGAACLKDQKGEVICRAGACARDQRGDVNCAQTQFGAAFRARDGWVICGRGQCATNQKNQYICSDIDGGAVVRVMDGSVRCQGQCEQASSEWCERQPADR